MAIALEMNLKHVMMAIQLVETDAVQYDRLSLTLSALNKQLQILIFDIEIQRLYLQDGEILGRKLRLFLIEKSQSIQLLSAAQFLVILINFDYK